MERSSLGFPGWSAGFLFLWALVFAPGSCHEQGSPRSQEGRCAQRAEVGEESGLISSLMMGGNEAPTDLWEEGEDCDETNSQDTLVLPWFHHKLTAGLSVSPSPWEMQSLTPGLEAARDSAFLPSTQLMESRVPASFPHPPSHSESGQARSPFSTLRTRGPQTPLIPNGRCHTQISFQNISAPRLPPGRAPLPFSVAVGTMHTPEGLQFNMIMNQSRSA